MGFLPLKKGYRMLSNYFNVPQKGVGKRGSAKGGRPLTIFFGHFLVTFSRFGSLFGNLFLFLVILPIPFACPILLQGDYLQALDMYDQLNTMDFG